MRFSASTQRLEKLSFTISFLVWQELSISSKMIHLKELDFDPHKAHKTALKLYAHSVLCAQSDNK